jgi:hypothetical protein
MIDLHPKQMFIQLTFIGTKLVFASIPILKTYVDKIKVGKNSTPSIKHDIVYV